MTKLINVLINAIPILIMIALIPIVSDDYVLAGLYILIILSVFWLKTDSGDIKALVAGFIFMTISEYIFISTGVETFIRNSFFGIMPIWLPILWAYGFVVIKRVVIFL